MNRNWNVLCWNVRGINSEAKWDALRSKIEESDCSVLCLQETKKESFDALYLKKFAPRKFDKFDYIPSVGASGGILIAWVGSIFEGNVIEKQNYAMTISFTSRHNGEIWNLTNVYGPCTEPARSEFLLWFRSLVIRDEDNWLLLGDFNFYRSFENRNRSGGILMISFVLMKLLVTLVLLNYH